MRGLLHKAFSTILLLLLLTGCEDDPILEPTNDDGGGGSYGNMSPLSSDRAAGLGLRNPETF